jgi:hypothetical protein
VAQVLINGVRGDRDKCGIQAVQHFLEPDFWGVSEIEAVKKRQRGLGLENTGVYLEMLTCHVERRSRLFSVFSDSVRRLLVLC